MFREMAGTAALVNILLIAHTTSRCDVKLCK